MKLGNIVTVITYAWMLSNSVLNIVYLCVVRYKSKQTKMAIHFQCKIIQKRQIFISNATKKKNIALVLQCQRIMLVTHPQKETSTRCKDRKKRKQEGKKWPEGVCFYPSG